MADKSKNLGIKFDKMKFGNPVGSNHTLDYEMLYCTNPPDVEFGNRSLTEWPRRIVVYQEGKTNSTDVPWAYSSSSIDFVEKPETILKVYDEWIKFLKYRRGIEYQIGISFYFEDNSMMKNWLSINELGIPDEYMQRLPEITHTGAENLRNISIWRHTQLQSIVNYLSTRADIISYQFASYSDDFFPYLCSINPINSPFQAKYFLRQLIETALFRVVIIDERIATAVDEKANLSKLDGSLGHLLAWMGVWVAGEVVFKKGIEEERITVGSLPTEENGLVRIVFDFKETGKIETSFQYANGKSEKKLPQINDSGIEMLTVHQTIIDGKFKGPITRLFNLSEQDYKGDWIDMIRPEVLFFYSHSGRGHVRSLLPRNASFLEYSFFQTHILNPAPSKFFFIQLALASKEERK